MRTKMKLIVLLCLLSLTNCFAYSYEYTGLSAKVMGLGYTFTGIADDPTTIYWNPAGIAEVNGMSFTSSNPYNIPNYRVSNISLSKSLTIGNRLGIDTGVGFLYNGEIGEVNDGTNTTKVGENRLGIGLAAAKGSVNIGGTYWFTQLIDGDKRQKEMSVDFGLLLSFGDAKIGVAIHNLNSEPVDTVLGASYTLPLGKFVRDLTIALDLTNCSFDGQSDLSWNMGIEAAFGSAFVVRLGSNAISPISSLGLGFSKKRWNFDYALNLHGLGYMHCLSVGYDL